RLLGRSLLWCFARVEPDEYHFEVFTGVERQHVERARHRIEHLRAEHRAGVVHKRENDRLAAEVVAEMYGASVFVFERRIEWQPLIEVLIEADLAQRSRYRGRNRARFLAVAGDGAAGHLGGTGYGAD